MSVRTYSASPRTRGSTPRRHRRQRRRQGFPAHAGIDLVLIALPKIRTGLPRARGDRPPISAGLTSSIVASPRTRGSTHDIIKINVGFIGFPAHAGIDLGVSWSVPIGQRLPRARGDRPPHVAVPDALDVASPRTRGSTLRRAVGRDIDQGFPAHAGIDLAPGRSPGLPSRLPRARGDRPFRCFLGGMATGASPRTRGSTRYLPNRVKHNPGFPAHAGIDPKIAFISSTLAGLPRARGDRPSASRCTRSRRQASPRTRGSTLEDGAKMPRLGGFPAHAGIDLADHPQAVARARLPRARGDRPQALSQFAAKTEASPRTRGSTPPEAIGRHHGRGFPAHAGIDPPSGPTNSV